MPCLDSTAHAASMVQSSPFVHNPYSTTPVASSSVPANAYYSNTQKSWRTTRAPAQAYRPPQQRRQSDHQGHHNNQQCQHRNHHHQGQHQNNHQSQHQHHNHRPQHGHSNQQRKPTTNNLAGKRPVCLDYLKGVCHLKRWKCKYAHPPLAIAAKTTFTECTDERKVCEVYMLTGLCKFGSNCRDYHPDLSEANPVCAPAKVVKEEKRSRRASHETDSPSSTTSSDRGSDVASNDTATSGSTSSVSFSSTPKSGLESSMRKVNGILNRLTPEKFDSLLQQLFELLTGDQTDACLTRVLPIVFARAINEQHMCELYARLTKHLYSLVGSEEQPILQEQLINLSANLLYKVEDVYEAVKDDAESLSKLQSKRLGNVQFFGELVKLDTLPWAKLHEALSFLFHQCTHQQQLGKSAEADFHVELICRLLTTVGADLNPHSAEAYVHNLQQVSHRHCTRVQMLVLNVVDLCFDKRWKQGNHNCRY